VAARLSLMRRIAVTALAALAACGSPALAQLSSPLAPGPSERTTPHLRVTWHAEPPRLAPDRPATLVLEVSPAPGMRVYAPGQLDYIPVTVTFEPNPSVTLGGPRLPKPVEHVFAPTGERSLVFDRPFRIEVPVSAARGKAAPAAKPGTRLDIAGTFQYQACDETLCYKPVRIPVSWSLETGPAAPKAPPTRPGA